jgi:hypothetical protein
MSELHHALRALVFDLDGTLLNADHTLSKATIQAVHDARAHGVKVVLASGRTNRSMAPFYQQLGLDTPLISYNGARVDYPDGEVTERRLTSAVVRGLIELARTRSVHLNLYGDDHWYTERAESEEAKRYATLAGLTPTSINLDEVVERGAVKGLFIAPAPQLKTLRAGLEQSELIDQLSLTSSMYHFLEVLPSRVNKGVALIEVMARLEIPISQVIAFGDGMNDLELLQVAGRGVAMENAHPALKAHATELAPPHDQDGVARYVRGLLAPLLS